jgi:hypothetical protein
MPNLEWNTTVKLNNVGPTIATLCFLLAWIEIEILWILLYVGRDSSWAHLRNPLSSCAKIWE